jgi:hypothetical protein
MNRFALKNPCPRHLFFFTALLIDALLGFELSRRGWVSAGVLVLLLAYMTMRRFADIGWNSGWALPYTLFMASPYTGAFFIWRQDVRIATLGVILLQLPAMAWPKKKDGAPVEAAS